MDYKSIIYKMVFENKSIREMAKEMNVPKSTLHYRLKKVKWYIEDEELLIDFELLMKDNKNKMAIKGALCRWEKEREETKC